jgi:hypothetical protein
MAGLDPATQQARVCGRKDVLSRADARYWVAASRAAMTNGMGESAYAQIRPSASVKFSPNTFSTARAL